LSGLSRRPQYGWRAPHSAVTTSPGSGSGLHTGQYACAARSTAPVSLPSGAEAIPFLLGRAGAGGIPRAPPRQPTVHFGQSGRAGATGCHLRTCFPLGQPGEPAAPDVSEKPGSWVGSGSVIIASDWRTA